MPDTAICTVPAAPLRNEASHRSEMTSQLLFGEVMEVLEEKDEWLRVKTASDDYEGWLTHHLVEKGREDWLSLSTTFVTTGLLNVLQTPDGPMHLPMGSTLPGYDPSSGKLWNSDFVYTGPYRHTTETAGIAEMLDGAKKWLNAPYLWGGKTVLGVDCSGFVQTVFKMAGYALPRDAWQQAEKGVLLPNIAEVKAGDLAFFHNEKGRVTHVGLLIGAEKIMHASGKVRIDGVDSAGIVQSSGLRTHQLHSVRRYLNG